MTFNIQPVKKDEITTYLNLIHELAVYEKMEDELVNTKEMLDNAIFKDKHLLAFLCFEDDVPIGFIACYFNYSTFTGKKGLYLEDLYLKPQFRGKGYGKAVFKYLKDYAKHHNCGRMEWTCLDWNEPSLAFYQKMEAKPLKEWIIHRLTEEQF